jgi:hypothetical protein
LRTAEEREEYFARLSTLPEHVRRHMPPPRLHQAGLFAGEKPLKAIVRLSESLAASAAEHARPIGLSLDASSSSLGLGDHLSPPHGRVERSAVTPSVGGRFAATPAPGATTAAPSTFVGVRGVVDMAALGPLTKLEYLRRYPEERRRFAVDMRERAQSEAAQRASEYAKRDSRAQRERSELAAMLAAVSPEAMAKLEARARRPGSSRGASARRAGGGKGRSRRSAAFGSLQRVAVVDDTEAGRMDASVREMLRLDSTPSPATATALSPGGSARRRGTTAFDTILSSSIRRASVSGAVGGGANANAGLADDLDDEMQGLIEAREQAKADAVFYRRAVREGYKLRAEKRRQEALRKTELLSDWREARTLNGLERPSLTLQRRVDETELELKQNSWLVFIALALGSIELHGRTVDVLQRIIATNGGPSEGGVAGRHSRVRLPAGNLPASTPTLQSAAMRTSFALASEASGAPRPLRRHMSTVDLSVLSAGARAEEEFRRHADSRSHAARRASLTSAPSPMSIDGATRSPARSDRMRHTSPPHHRGHRIEHGHEHGVSPAHAALRRVLGVWGSADRAVDYAGRRLKVMQAKDGPLGSAMARREEQLRARAARLIHAFWMRRRQAFYREKRRRALALLMRFFRDTGSTLRVPLAVRLYVRTTKQVQRAWRAKLYLRAMHRVVLELQFRAHLVSVRAALHAEAECAHVVARQRERELASHRGLSKAQRQEAVNRFAAAAEAQIAQLAEQQRRITHALEQDMRPVPAAPALYRRDGVSPTVADPTRGSGSDDDHPRRPQQITAAPSGNAAEDAAGEQTVIGKLVDQYAVRMVRQDNDVLYKFLVSRRTQLRQAQAGGGAPVKSNSMRSSARPTEATATRTGAGGAGARARNSVAASKGGAHTGSTTAGERTSWPTPRVLFTTDDVTAMLTQLHFNMEAAMAATTTPPAAALVSEAMPSSPAQ